MSAYARPPLLMLVCALLCLDFWLCARFAAAAPAPTINCLLTFAEVDAAAFSRARPGDVVEELRLRCPAHCVALARGAAVYGSFPYAGNSSFCLAAVHCGAIRDDVGGLVRSLPFSALHQPVVLDLTDPHSDRSAFLANGSYRVRVANVSMLELFPLNSSLPSFSNGVQSLPIQSGVTTPEQLRQLEARGAAPIVPLTQYAYTVRTRGMTAQQRQVAPFSARSGHIHISNAEYLTELPSTWPAFHLVLFGRNDTHYFNVSRQRTTSAFSPHCSSLTPLAVECCRTSGWGSRCERVT